MRIILLMLFFFSTISLSAKTISGAVVRVIDGNSFILASEKKQYLVKLWGVDAPVGSQEYSSMAAAYLSGLLKFSRLTVNTVGYEKTEKNDRKNKNREPEFIVGKVLQGKTDINLKMIDDGFAWWDSTSAAKAENFKKAEQDARSAQRGLWRGLNPERPSEWREKNPKGAKEKSYNGSGPQYDYRKKEQSKSNSLPQ